MQTSNEAQEEMSIHLNETAFVTAADHSHFQESIDSIASAQRTLPLTHKIIYYDLGLKETQVEEVLGN